MVKPEESDQFNNFDRMMQRLIKVPHSKIKAKLEEEKAKKKTKAESGQLKVK